MHVLADALTSILAITALLSGKFYGWNWLDPVMGIVGALIITRWSYTLLRDTAPTLLDGGIDVKEVAAITDRIESRLDNKVADIHVWRVGPADYAAIVSIVTHYPQKMEYYKELLSDFESLSHVTLEINACGGEPCVVPPRQDA